VNLKNEQSVKLVENTIFQNNNLDLTNVYSTSFMNGKVLNSYLLLNIGSIMCNNPHCFKFISDMIDSRPDSNQLMTLQVKNSILEGRKYGEVYSSLMSEHSPVKILPIGILTFSRFFKLDFLGNMLEDLKNDEYHQSKGWENDQQDSDSQDPHAKEAENIKIPPISVVMLNPAQEYVLHADDILYGFGTIKKEDIAEFYKLEEFINDDTYETIEMIREREKEKAEVNRAKFIRKHNVKLIMEVLRDRVKNYSE